MPDLSPDRVRIAPHESEAIGLELNASTSLSEQLAASGTLAWSRVADNFRAGDHVLRSWDQPLSLTAGLTWKASRSDISALVGWHRGWPRTPFQLAPLALGSRNADRWGNYLSLDVRGSWRWQFANGELSAVLDLTNATNRNNECCAVLNQPDNSAAIESENDHWLPTSINIGFTYRWRGTQ